MKGAPMEQTMYPCASLETENAKGCSRSLMDSRLSGQQFAKIKAYFWGCQYLI